jgi:hypothetical protein
MHLDFGDREAWWLRFCHSAFAHGVVVVEQNRKGLETEAAKETRSTLQRKRGWALVGFRGPEALTRSTHSRAGPDPRNA